MTAATALLLLRGTCLAVPGERIAASDLAIRVPALRSVSAEAVFGFTPRFGVRRFIAPQEIQAFAQRYGVSLDRAPELCIERPHRTLEQAAIETAIRRTLSEASASSKEAFGMEVIAWAKSPVPFGAIEFPLTGLHQGSAEEAAYWRGSVRTQSGQRYPVWAKLRVWSEQEVLVAARPIAAGQAITAEDLAREKRRMPVRTLVTGASGEQARSIGMLATRAIAAGELIPARSLKAPREVARGESVRVEAGAGQTKLTIEATAETAGSRGERILVRNPQNGRRFQAIVTGVRSATAVDETPRAEPASRQPIRKAAAVSARPAAGGPE